MSSSSDENTRLLRLHHNHLFFADGFSIELSATNIPQETLIDPSPENVFWEVRVLNYDKNTGAIQFEVLNYFVRECDSYYQQQPKGRINRVYFSNLTESATLKQAIRHYVKNITFKESPEESPPIKAPLLDFGHNLEKEQNRTENFEIRKTLQIPFVEANFKLGYVTFFKRFKELDDTVYFKIPNDFVRPEFDHIKNYFEKALKRKTFDADIEVVIRGNKVTETKAHSPEIDKIDEGLIQTVKISRTLACARAVQPQVDQSLFTEENLFDQLTDDEMGNIFEQDEQDILEILMNSEGIRNRKQLSYLAGKKQKSNQKIRFTMQPDFGFLFLIEGENMNHFCWELLHSNATYLWSIDKGDVAIDMQYRRIEDSINNIRASNRTTYKRAYRENHVDEDLIFSVIKHDSINSDFKDGFVLWKHKLNEKLI